MKLQTVKLNKTQINKFLKEQISGGKIDFFNFVFKFSLGFRFSKKMLEAVTDRCS